MNDIKILCAFSMFTMSGVSLISNAAGNKKIKNPNVILILTDDQGYGDMSCHGNPWLKTPNIDKLSKISYNFEDYHSNLCSAPARSGLLTGKYNDEVGVWHTVRGRSILRSDDKTLANILQENGYETGIFGKWHLGDNYPYRPIDRGFKEALWFKGGGLTQTPDYWGNDLFDDVYWRNDHLEKQKGYCTDIWFDNALKFIKKNKDNPFFVYLSLNAPHGPLHVEEKYVESYRNNSNIVSPEYFGMIANMDENIGKFMEQINKMDLDKNTIIIFSSDNGGCDGMEEDRNFFVTKGYNSGMRGCKGDVYEGGHRSPLFIKPPSSTIYKQINQLTASIDFTPTILDLCNIKVKDTEEMTGISLKNIMYGDSKEFERYVVFDKQKQDTLKRKNTSVVCYKKWRLINDKDLYNIDSDPGQRKNIAAKYPNLVVKLKEMHNEWWEKHIVPIKKEVSYIPITQRNGKDVEINCHDRRNIEQEPCVWLQTFIRQGMLPVPTSFWSVEVKEEGSYNFDLYRWPITTNAKLMESVPAGGPIPNGISYKKGVAITDINGAEITIGNQHRIIYVSTDSIKNKTHLHFQDIYLKPGKYRLYVNFTREKNDPFGALFVKIHKNKKTDLNLLPYMNKWESLDKYPQAQWLNKLKFGMYWHWGVTSVPGVAGWYGRFMYNTKSKLSINQVKKYGSLDKFGYKDFVPMFTAKKFNANQWISNAQRVGAKFVLGMASHHDGFSMYNDTVTPWNSVNKGPHRDIIGELAAAARKKNMKFGVTSHLAFNWNFFSENMYPNKFDAKDAPMLYNIHNPIGHASEKFVKQWYNRTRELIDNYDVDMLWFDFGTRDSSFCSDYTSKITSYYYNHAALENKQVALVGKLGFKNKKSLVLDKEHAKFNYIRYPLWMADCTFNDHWFNERVEENAYTTTGQYWLYQLIDIVSKNGTLLLNMGPKADGSWEPTWKKELFKIGDWLKINGEAIYNTTPWHRFGEGLTYGGGEDLGDNLTSNDIRFTRKGDILYAIVCGWRTEPILIKSLGTNDIKKLRISKVSMLGYKNKLQWIQRGGALSVTFPNRPIKGSKYAYVLKIEGDGLFPKRTEYLPQIVSFPDTLKNIKEVRVEIPGNKKQLSLAELYVMGQDFNSHFDNIALYGKAISSSQAYGFEKNKLIDNNTNGNPLMQSIASTKEEKNPWLGVTFDREHDVFNIIIFLDMENKKNVIKNAVLNCYNKRGKIVFSRKIKEFTEKSMTAF